MTTLKDIGQNLREYRIQKGYTQERLANEVGTSASHLRLIEKGEGNPTFKTIGVLAKALEVSLNDLLRNHENMSFSDKK